MRFTLPAAILTLLAVAPAPDVFAMPCGDVTTDGVCSDSKTLVFCDRGTLETLACPTGEICTHDDRFGGAAGCIATAMAGCGDVPEGGACAGAETLLFCEHRAVVERRCPAGTVCTWVAEEDWYDCVSRTVEQPEVPPETPDSTPETPPEPEPTPSAPADDDTHAERLAPTVTPGGAPAAGDFVAGGSGCGAGGVGGLAWLLGPFVFLFGYFRRR